MVYLPTFTIIYLKNQPNVGTYTIWIRWVICFHPLILSAPCRLYMGGVQNSRSQGLYAVRRVGIEQLILHLRYKSLESSLIPVACPSKFGGFFSHGTSLKVLNL